MNSVCVKVNPQYSVLIGRGILEMLGDELKQVTRANKVLVVTDSNVEKLYLARVSEILKEADFVVSTFVFEAGERSKTPATYLDIIDRLGQCGFKRTDAVIALGGGVVGDIAGFAAATYMRGIDVVQVPTTLLAMIDSSIGGKTGVDLAYGKNLLGAFHQPKLVLADTSLLETLPQKEWANGVGEGIKYACLVGGRIADIMRDGLGDNNLDEFVSLCARYKADVVAEDEKEGGMRKLLNFGHTVGHAIEKNSNFEIAHGVAVAMGIGIMANSASRQGEISADDYKIIAEMLDKLGVAKNAEIDENTIKAIAMDKKSEGKNDISVVTINAIGCCQIQKMTTAEFEKYINAK